MAATTGLNVIALISGGKDSLFSLLHCLENGHRLTALANLYPSAGEGESKPESDDRDDTVEQDDLNSFMYQTVGHTIVPLYAECLGLPLYRRAITGSATQTGRYYDSSGNAAAATGGVEGAEPKDETEDLIPLLQSIRQKHPEANALCSGAILSTYQRTRVESVAIRLGLTPLAYLWQYPALPPPMSRPDSLTGLLEDMAAARCDARIIKIASGGIPESLLWANVGDPRTQKRLVSGLAPFFEGHEFWLRGAVLGEGGEYETLAVNGPRRLWRKRIEVEDGQIGVVTREGGVHYGVLRGARVVDRDKEIHESGVVDAAVPVPRPLDEQFQAVLSHVQLWEERQLHSDLRSPPAQTFALAQNISKNNTPLESLRLTQTSTASNLFIANLTVQDTAAAAVQRTQPLSAAEQMQHIVSHLQQILKSRSSSTTTTSSPQITPSSIISTTLLLRSMADFASVNTAYSALFRPGEPNPPARVTFSCSPLPPGVDVSLSVVLSLAPRHSRRALHVQSRSYWAPANIGPYSQAICEPLSLLDGPRGEESLSVNVHDARLVEVVHVAGQIPLVPQSMQIESEKGFGESAVLSLQHLWRVGQERGVDVWSWGIALLEGGDGREGESHLSRAEQARKVWQHTHLVGTGPERSGTSDDGNDNDDGGEVLDAWDLRFNRSTAFQSSHLQVTIGAHLHTLPNPKVFSDGSITTYIPSFIAATVTALPRDAPVEWWSLGIANLPPFPTSKPRADVLIRSYPWGVISMVTIEPAISPEEGSLQRALSVTNLVTLLVRSSTARDTAADAGIADIEKELSKLFLAGSNADPDAQSQLQAVHGTAFIASEGERYWRQIASESMLAATAVVLCISLFGSPAMTISKKSSEFSNTVENAPPPPCQQQLTSQSTGTADCQPLDLALTLRLERLVAI